MLKIRRPLGRLIFNMGIAIPGKTVFLIETAPWMPKCKSSGYFSVPNFMPYLPSDLLAKTQKNAVNQRTDNNAHKRRLIESKSSGYTSMPKCRPFLPSDLSAISRVSYMDTSACQILCHSFQVTCQQMCRNLKIWWTNGQTDRQTDRQKDILMPLNLVQDKNVVRNEYLKM